jgi:hypothetical protein
MCPVCLATTAWIAASIVTTGGVGALLLKRVATGKAAGDSSSIAPSAITTPKEDHHG